MGTQAAGEHRIAIDHEMMRRDRRRQPSRAAGQDEIDRIYRRNVLEHDLEFWMAPSQRIQHAVDEDRFAIEYVDFRIDYFAVHEQGQARPGHLLENAVEPADIGNARVRMGRRPSRG